MLDAYGYKTRRLQRTFDSYNDVDSVIYSGIHDWIKFLKHGYGKATDHACREIRWNRLNRIQGIELVEKYQNKVPEEKDIKKFSKWLQISELELNKIIITKSKANRHLSTNNSEYQPNELLNEIIHFKSNQYLDKEVHKTIYPLIGKYY